MAQTTVRCPHCKETHPVFLKDLGKVLYCPVRQAQFRLARLGSVYILLDVLGNGALGSFIGPTICRTSGRSR